MCVAAFLNDIAACIDLGITKIGRDIECVGQSIEDCSGLVFKFVDKVFDEIGIGALVVAINLNDWFAHRCSRFRNPLMFMQLIIGCSDCSLKPWY